MAKSLLLQTICQVKPPGKDFGGLDVSIFRHPLRNATSLVYLH